MSSSTAQTTDSQSDIKSWIKSHLTPLFDSSEHDTAFDTAFSSSVQAKKDNDPVSLQDLKEQLSKGGAAITQASVSWDDLEAIDDGTAKGAITVTRNMKFRVRAAPAQTLLIIHFTAKVEPPFTSGSTAEQISSERKITEFNYTAESKAVPPHFARPHASGEGEAEGEEDSEK